MRVRLLGEQRRDFLELNFCLRLSFGHGGLGFNRLSRKRAERLSVGDQAQWSSATDRTTPRLRWDVGWGDIGRTPARKHDGGEKGNARGRILPAARNMYTVATTQAPEIKISCNRRVADIWVPRRRLTCDIQNRAVTEATLLQCSDHPSRGWKNERWEPDSIVQDSVHECDIKFQLLLVSSAS